MGCAVEQDLVVYDQLIEEPWLAEMVDAIRAGYEDLKKELPFRAAHYSHFAEDRRTQKNADPESFLFQTTVDVDKMELVEPTIKKALALNEDETSPWFGMLLHADYSARGKVHFDIRMPIGMTISETQRAYCEALGISDEYDEACTSPERIIFITDKRQEIYRDDGWHARLPAEELTERRKAFTDRGLTIDGRLLDKNGNTVKETTRRKGDVMDTQPQKTVANIVADEKATTYSLTAFDLCVKEAGLTSESLDVWGIHNWHTNLKALLSVGLPKLMTKEQLMAVVKVKLPNYSQTEDCQNMIAYFYERYSADKGFMSAPLREINSKAQQIASTRSSESEDDQDEKDAEELVKDWDLPKLPKKIPRIMELLVDNYDPRFREMLLLSALPVLSAHASHFRAEYLNGRIIGPQQYVAIIGGSGKGKSNCTELYKEMIKNTLEDHDNREWEKVKENADMRDKMANAKERPPKYHPKLRLFETTSKSSILELQTNLGKNGMLLGQFSEVDGLSGMSKAAFSDISVLLRKAWDMDVHRQFYMSDATCNTQAQMSISLLMAGTVRAMLERMFSDKNCEGGFMQRCIPVIVPKTKRTFRPPRQNFLSSDQKLERDALMMELYQKDLSLGDDTLVLETPLTNRAIGEWFDSLEVIYNDGMMTDAEADLSHRCGEFMLRAAIPLIALYGQETKEIIDFARWVGETAFYVMTRLFGHRVQDDIFKSDELLSDHTDQRKTVEPLLDMLPGIFTTQQVKEVREKVGQSSNVRMLLSRYCKSGKIIKTGKGVYRKASHIVSS